MRKTCLRFFRSTVLSIASTATLATAATLAPATQSPATAAARQPDPAGFSLQSVKSPAEHRYFTTRDGYILEFGKSSALQAEPDRKALADLERQLIPIVGPVKVEGFAAPLKINLTTLQQDGGFDKVDGLRAGNPSDSEILVVSTPSLIANYLGRHPDLARDLRALSRDEGFYHKVFDPGAALTYFVELPVKPGPEHAFARAFLGLLAQDSGPFPPGHIYVFTAAGQQIRMVSAKANVAVKQIEQCKNRWDGFAKKSEAALERYRVSELKDTAAYKEHTRLASKGSDAYIACFAAEAGKQAYFKPLVSQAQSIVNRLR